VNLIQIKLVRREARSCSASLDFIRASRREPWSLFFRCRPGQASRPDAWPGELRPGGHARVSSFRPCIYPLSGR